MQPRRSRLTRGRRRWIPMRFSEEELATLADPRLGLPAEVIAWVAGTGPAVPMPKMPEPGGRRTGPDVSFRWSFEIWEIGNRVAALPFNILAATGTSSHQSDGRALPARVDPAKSVEDHIVQNHETLAAVYETLAQGRVEIAKAKAASGD